MLERIAYANSSGAGRDRREHSVAPTRGAHAQRLRPAIDARPGVFQSLVCAEAMAITAGIAAASITRHGIAAHTAPVAKALPEAVEAGGARGVLQI